MKRLPTKPPYWAENSGVPRCPRLVATDLAAQMQLHGCDLTTDMIGKIEIGYRAVSVYEIDKFVEVIGVTYDALFAK